MTREQLDKHWDLIEAYKNGAVIQFRTNKSIGWVTIDTYPGWSIDTEYRIKPEPEYVPFTFEDIDKFIGKVVKSKDASHISIILSATYDGIRIGGVAGVYKYIELLQIFTFLDGTPCGKLNNY